MKLKRYIVARLKMYEVEGRQYPSDLEILGVYKTKKEAEKVKGEHFPQLVIVKQIEID